ncbi:shikimate dehydrogenase [Rathayibacter sp. YIM 133350]|uniref:shikimate dehydrogenase n=1 Tax=Rathayibacter sp. YIM 133350 TaxID=3131992 RepID=UPI00307E16C5
MTATRLAVLGSPIEHSRSPQLHLAAYRHLGLDWSYERIELGESALGDFLAARGPDWRGLSLTMPLKDEAFRLARTRDRLAAATASVNTLLWDERRAVHGFNTDVPGLVNAVREQEGAALRDVLVLGAGATARSAVVAAAELGAEAVHVAVRTPAKGEALAPLAASVGLRVSVGALDALPDRADLVISTLPGGVELAASPPVDLRSEALLFDVAYAPWPSALAEAWEAAGGRAVSGLGMLLHQALVQVRIFVAGDPLAPMPDEEGVLAAMRAALA